MPLPRSVNKLKRFLGMVNYLGNFVHNLAEHTTPLCNLEKDAVFESKKACLTPLKVLNLSNISTFSKDFRLKITESFKNRF